jgi:Kef-type K+ transport system membrane component KefB
MRELWSQLVGRVTEGPNAANLGALVLALVLMVAPLAARRVRMPSLVVLLLLGMAMGPHGAKILATKQQVLSVVGGVGLLYLMFTAGLELDLGQLARDMRAALAFAALSFAIPFTVGLVCARLLSYGWRASVLMGSNWGSHTLVCYPLLRQMGLARTRPASIVVGATALTDTAALMVLAGVTVATRRSGGFLAVGTELVIGLVILVLWNLLALPRVAHRFFARIGADQAQRLVFAIVALLVGAILAEAAGIDGIVGAFFAGLGLGRAVPEQSPLMERTQFLGTALLIPIFLVSVGVLLEPQVLIQPKTLLYALVFAAVVLGGKSLAAIVVGRRAGFAWPEVGIMCGLSGSQAAATLATVLVGARLHLFDELTVNAVLVVILLTLIITPGVVSFSGRRMRRERTVVARLGHKVIVPIWDESTRALLPVAARLAEPDHGLLEGVAFGLTSASDEELAIQQRLRDDAETWLATGGLEARALFRVTSSSSVGLVEAIRGEGATLMVADWAPLGRRFDEQNAELAAACPVPLLLVQGPVEPFERIVLVAFEQDAAQPGRRDLELALELSKRLVRRGTRRLVVAQATDGVRSPLTAQHPGEDVADRDPLGWIVANRRESDLVFLPGLEAAREALRRLPERVARRFLVAIAPRPTG